MHRMARFCRERRPPTARGTTSNNLNNKEEEYQMRKLLLIGVALAALGAATPALAQEADAAVGATAGGATGGTIGFLLGGPIGAIVGGWAGAVIGADAAVSTESVKFAGENPVDPVIVDADLDVGFVVPEDITIHAIEGDDEFGYFYANNRVYIVSLADRTIVQSPGFLIPEKVVAFVEANPVESVTIEGDLAAGVQLGADIEIAAIPDDPSYGYVYVDDRPALVDLDSRMVVWVR
jgi:outer membrane lipoprotein SlyB